MTPSPRLLQSLQRSRVLVRSAKATVGVGERRSNAKGSGMEFLDYREYQPGDDVRHLDPHLFARTGGHYVRQYAVYQQLPITIIVDGSASMNFSESNACEPMIGALPLRAASPVIGDFSFSPSSRPASISRCSPSPSS